MEIISMIRKATPISIRKLKNFYVIRTRCRYYIIRGHSHIYLYVHESNEDIMKYPNLYINKKFVDSKQTYINRYDYNEYDKVVVNTSAPADKFSLCKSITFYAVFESESEYLKWKLRS